MVGRVETGAYSSLKLCMNVRVAVRRQKSESCGCIFMNKKQIDDVAVPVLSYACNIERL